MKEYHYRSSCSPDFVASSTLLASQWVCWFEYTVGSSQTKPEVSDASEETHCHARIVCNSEMALGFLTSTTCKKVRHKSYTLGHHVWAAWDHYLKTWQLALILLSVHVENIVVSWMDFGCITCIVLLFSLWLVHFVNCFCLWITFKYYSIQ